MSEKKYIFKIDNSKAVEKFGRNLETHGREKITSSDFKVTCVNCLYYKEIEVDANYYPYRPMLFIPDLHFTIVKSENVIDIVKDENRSVEIVKSNGDENAIAYLSDKNGNMTLVPEYDERWITNIIKDFKDLYDAISNCGILLLENLTDTYIQNIVEHLTDDQLQGLVDHLTNHQLKTLAQELNETKLKVIVPILNENQLETLVKGLNPGQLENILPHLKIDQFKVLIKNIDDYQFIDLARSLSEHHLTILSKELEPNRLHILVNNLEGDKLKDLVNKLDHEKLEVIARDLIEPSRVQVIVKSLAGSPGKLQIFARNMPDQQFAELLNNLDAKELKDIIHKLPYEKVTTVIGQSGDKHQLDFIVRVLEEKLGEQSEKLREILDKVDQMRPAESEKIFESVPNISSQDSNAELMEAMTYVQYQPEYL